MKLVFALAALLLSSSPSTDEVAVRPALAIHKPAARERLTIARRPTTTLPYFGPARSSLEVFGTPPPDARPDKRPYFGKRPAKMPNVHFMDPKLPAEPANE